MEIGFRTLSPRYAITLLLLLCASTLTAQLQFDKLTCAFAENPIGIDGPQPRFGWTFFPIGRNQRQSAYELTVADNPDFNSGIQWFTGKILSTKNSGIEYSGKPLQSFTSYFWRVRTYDQDNRPS